MESPPFIAIERPKNGFLIFGDDWRQLEEVAHYHHLHLVPDGEHASSDESEEVDAAHGNFIYNENICMRQQLCILALYLTIRVN